MNTHCSKCKRDSIYPLQDRQSISAIGEYKNFCVFCEVCSNGHMIRFELSHGMVICLTCYYHKNGVEELKNRLLMMSEMRCSMYNAYYPRGVHYAQQHMKLISGPNGGNIVCDECSVQYQPNNRAWMSANGYMMLNYFENSRNFLRNALTTNDFNNYQKLVQFINNEIEHAKKEEDRRQQDIWENAKRNAIERERISSGAVARAEMQKEHDQRERERREKIEKDERERIRKQRHAVEWQIEYNKSEKNRKEKEQQYGKRMKSYFWLICCCYCRHNCFEKEYSTLS